MINRGGRFDALQIKAKTFSSQSSACGKCWQVAATCSLLKSRVIQNDFVVLLQE
jgi:hypothetical protein